MRLLVDLPDAQVQALAALCKQVQQPRTALIREAIADYLARHVTRPRDAAFGLWGNQAPDGLDLQEQARTEW